MASLKALEHRVARLTRSRDIVAARLVRIWDGKSTYPADVAREECQNYNDKLTEAKAEWVAEWKRLGSPLSNQSALGSMTRRGTR